MDQAILPSRLFLRWLEEGSFIRGWETEMGGISSEQLQIFLNANIFLEEKDIDSITPKMKGPKEHRFNNSQLERPKEFLLKTFYSED